MRGGTGYDLTQYVTNPFGRVPSNVNLTFQLPATIDGDTVTGAVPEGTGSTQTLHFNYLTIAGKVSDDDAAAQTELSGNVIFNDGSITAGGGGEITLDANMLGAARAWSSSARMGS